MGNIEGKHIIKNIDKLSEIENCKKLKGSKNAFRIKLGHYRIGFIFEKELMKEHFNEKYMESDKFPMASFKGIINEEVDLTKDGEFPATAKGKLTIHGVEQELTLVGRIKRSGTSITIISDFKVALKDHKITVPKLLFENIAEIIEVHVSLEYKPYQKTSTGK